MIEWLYIRGTPVRLEGDEDAIDAVFDDAILPYRVEDIAVQCDEHDVEFRQYE